MDIFAKDWTGEPFGLFGPPHLIGLGLIVIFIILIIRVGRQSTIKEKRTIRIILAGVLLVTEISWHLWNYFTGQWTIQTMLPLHLCSILVWLSIFMLLTKHAIVYEFAYLLGIAGALQALLTPDAGIYGFPHFRFFQVMISHGTLIAAALYMTLVEGYRPTPVSLKRVIIGSNLYMIGVFILNLLIGSNYMFIAHKPDTASLLDVLPAWPWYIFVIELLGLAFIFLFYAPFAIVDRKTKRTQTI